LVVSIILLIFVSTIKTNNMPNVRIYTKGLKGGKAIKDINYTAIFRVMKRLYQLIILRV